MYAVLDHVLKYGTYCLIGVFVLFGKPTSKPASRRLRCPAAYMLRSKARSKSIRGLWKAAAHKKRLEEWENASAPSTALPTRMEIEWRGVSFSYDKPVLKNVTARMDLTQNHIIRGENGAGKSTLIKLLLGMETPQSGEISVLGSATGQLDKTLFPSEIFLSAAESAGL